MLLITNNFAIVLLDLYSLHLIETAELAVKGGGVHPLRVT